MPNFTVSSPDQTFSSTQALFLALVSVALYGVFLMIQNVRHPNTTGAAALSRRVWNTRLVGSRTLLLLAYMVLGSVLATISLTIPAVLTFGLLTGTNIILGLDPVGITLLAVTLALTMLTFTTSRR